FGLGGSVTLGIVSARNRDIDSGPYDNFIQTDAAINRGNSGGPLFDMTGGVVGINTAIISPTGGSIGIGFAVPALTAVGVIDQLRRFGETRRGWLGVQIQDVTDFMAESLGLDVAVGALVAGVTMDGPAETAGLLAGDIILDFDGQAIDDADKLPRIVAYKAIGAVVEVVVLRDGQERAFDVTLGRLEDAERVAAIASVPDEGEGGSGRPPTIAGPFGLILADLTAVWRDELAIAHDLQGVVVTDVSPGSLAEEKRFRPGDVIVEIAQERISNASEIDVRIEELRAQGRTTAMFLLANRHGDLRFVAMSIDG
ncbi:MAG: PDZ domain-containing protein, partial [Alphaproteobacteria bacterium]